jgi:hypothetical protein
MEAAGGQVEAVVISGGPAGLAISSQAQRLPMIRDVGRRQLGRQRDPDGRDGGHHLPFPAVAPAVPPRLAPVRFGIARAVGDDASIAVLLVPAAAVRPQDSAVDGGSTPDLAQDWINTTSIRPRQPICAGSVAGMAWSRRSQVRLAGKRPSTVRRPRKVCLAAGGCASTLRAPHYVPSATLYTKKMERAGSTRRSKEIVMSTSMGTPRRPLRPISWGHSARACVSWATLRGKMSSRQGLPHSA